MTFALDSSVLIDVLLGDAAFGPRSRDLLAQAGGRGRLVACEAVWAEIGAMFASPRELTIHMDELGVDYSPLHAAAAERAGQLWRSHRRNRVARSRIVADFLIGAHALLQADALLTRDRGFFREYFYGLKILDPTGPH